ncbi:MAG: hypothetical protein ACRDQ5_02955 [Sciscionella sp.]
MLAPAALARRTRLFAQRSAIQIVVEHTFGWIIKHRPEHLPTVISAVNTDTDEAVRAYAAATLGLLEASDYVLRRAQDAEPSSWVRGELGFARFRRGDLSLREALTPFETADWTTAARLLSGLEDIVQRAPVPITTTDLDVVTVALEALLGRLPDLDGQVRKVIEKWHRAAQT